MNIQTAETDKPEPILTIEIVRFENGTYFASGARDGSVFWGITHSPRDVPDLLRNTAEAMEKIHEISPDQFPQLFGVAK